MGFLRRSGRRVTTALTRLFKTTAGLLAIALLTGCWSSIELNNRAFVSVMLIDQTDKGVELTLGFPLTNRLIPGQTGGSGVSATASSAQPNAYISRVGPSLEDALQKIQGDVPRQIAFGQTHSIIIGSRFAERGVEPILEFVLRNPYLKMNTNLFLVEGPVRNKVAQMSIPFERFLASVLNGYVSNRQIMSTTVKDLMYSKANGGDGLLPILGFIHNNAALAPGSPPSLTTAGAAILRNGKLVETRLKPSELSSARAILNQLKQYIYSIDSPTDGGKIGFYTTSLDMTIRPALTGEDFKIVIRCKLQAVIIASDSEIDLESKGEIRQLEQAINKIANEGFASVVAKTRQAGADVFGFALYFSVRYPREWNRIKEQWRDYYKNRLEVKIETDAMLKRSGSSVHSIREKFLNDEA
ncbi:Ger(x)C family spore germination protein [Cohnella fermenti]|uniref:Ger(X)C family spore germination protein n=1 Tax=Cohnella fermenti TaxID=2565925 RepID=A0A4S4BNX1_9BACL|nr:Ger(x)C family spore germination protein [Cohnella fermenti]THF76538.1 Ger(x)C family spore germination protein [Cohnella fermenti]